MQLNGLTSCCLLYTSIEKQKDFSDEELKEFYRHPQIGNRIIRSMFGYEEIATAELYHHEWWNGRGYPYGLKGEDIPYMARFITIVDSYDWHKLNLGYDEGENLTMEEIEAFYANNKAVRDVYKRQESGRNSGYYFYFTMAC